MFTPELGAFSAPRRKVADRAATVAACCKSAAPRRVAKSQNQNRSTALLDDSTTVFHDSDASLTRTHVVADNVNGCNAKAFMFETKRVVAGMSFRQNRDCDAPHINGGNIRERDPMCM